MESRQAIRKITSQPESLQDLKIQHELKCQFANNDFDLTVCEIWKSIGYNSGKFSNPYKVDDVERVLRSYYNLQLQNRSLPELDIVVLSKGTKEERNAQTLLINTVAENSAAEAGFVRQVLEQLFYGTKDGRIKSARMLYPRRYDATLGNPENESWDKTINSYMKTGVVVVGVVGAAIGLYYVGKTFNLFSQFSQKNNG